MRGAAHSGRASLPGGLHCDFVLRIMPMHLTTLGQRAAVEVAVYESVSHATAKNPIR